MTSSLWASPRENLDSLPPHKTAPSQLRLAALNDWVSKDLEHALSRESLDSEAFQLFHQHAAGLVVRRWLDAALQVAYATKEPVLPVQNVKSALREAVEEAVSELAVELELDVPLVHQIVDSLQKKTFECVSLGHTVTITSTARLEPHEEGPRFILTLSSPD